MPTGANPAYAVVFLLLAGLLLAVAVGVGGWAWVLLWPVVSLAVVAAGYGLVGPRVFGKRRDGTLPAQNVALLFPLLQLLWAIWHVQRAVSRDPAWHEVAPGLLLGRRVLARERPEAGLVIDLTSEFTEPRAVRSLPGYRCLPTLDASAPHDLARFREVVAEVAAFDGRVFVHCANGRGRSAVFAAAVLVARGMELKEALKTVRAGRTSVRLNRVQLSWLRRVAST
ncbi:MAG TPA: dual specificity protein phosphatase family protein [Gemmataceae bacterium]|nr:dual specificity protein phosphatase family protein [Gemmataceae bacterium]